MGPPESILRRVLSPPYPHTPLTLLCLLCQLNAACISQLSSRSEPIESESWKSWRSVALEKTNESLQHLFFHVSKLQILQPRRTGAAAQPELPRRRRRRPLQRRGVRLAEEVAAHGDHRAHLRGEEVAGCVTSGFIC